MVLVVVVDEEVVVVVGWCGWCCGSWSSWSWLGSGLVVVPAAARQRRSHRQREGGERCKRPAHDPPSSAGWRSPQYGQSLTSKPMS